MFQYYSIYLNPVFSNSSFILTWLAWFLLEANGSFPGAWYVFLEMFCCLCQIQVEAPILAFVLYWRSDTSEQGCPDQVFLALDPDPSPSVCHMLNNKNTVHHLLIPTDVWIKIVGCCFVWSAIYMLAVVFIRNSSCIANKDIQLIRSFKKCLNCSKNVSTLAAFALTFGNCVLWSASPYDKEIGSSSSVFWGDKNL